MKFMKSYTCSYQFHCAWCVQRCVCVCVCVSFSCLWNVFSLHNRLVKLPGFVCNWKTSKIFLTVPTSWLCNYMQFVTHRIHSHPRYMKDLSLFILEKFCRINERICTTQLYKSAPFITHSYTLFADGSTRPVVYHITVAACLCWTWSIDRCLNNILPACEWLLFQWYSDFVQN
jgi:hypothetical protein